MPDLAGRIRGHREGRGWTLSEAAMKLGVGRSSLSKIEAGQMSPTVGLLQKIAQGLDVDITALLSGAAVAPVDGRRTITRAGAGQIHSYGGNEHEALCGELAKKRMLPIVSRIRPRSEGEPTVWYRNEGEEFAYVLDGRVQVHSEFYEPAELTAGDAVYFDGRMDHYLSAAGDADAVVLFVIAS